jgi:hypothetical protein
MRQEVALASMKLIAAISNDDWIAPQSDAMVSLRGGEKAASSGSGEYSVIARVKMDNIDGNANACARGSESAAGAEMQAACTGALNADAACGADRVIAESPLSPEIREPKVLWASLLDLV